MTFPVRQNALDQALDIAGSLTQSSTFTIGDEVNGYGPPFAGQTGAGASITTFAAGIATVTGLTGIDGTTQGESFLQISGAASAGNNGVFLIVAYNSSSSVNVSNPNGVASDANNGSIVWTQREPYRLEDDLNYERTDRTLIKGVPYYQTLAPYTRPTATNVNVPMNLTNITAKTTDAVAYNVNRAFYGVALQDGYTQVTITSAGNFKHADPINETGVPCFDAAPFTGDWTSCYVHIVDGYSTGDELVVLTGPHAGERIFGQTYNGSSTSPNSVEVHFYSAPFAVNYTGTNTPYTWESGQPLTVNFLYGYNERLDQLDQNAFRTVPALGILTDASLANDVNNILETLGSTAGTTNLSGLLTNTTTYFPFYYLPNATPSVVDALNTLNTQIGNETYTGPVLTSGQTITASLQALSNAISSSHVTRTIERLAAAIPANTVHTLPGGITYTLDGTNNGQYLWVFARGALKDPGPVSGGNDYAETSTTSITFYNQQKSTDHINYFIKT
jgi:hypothetical protein